MDHLTTAPVEKFSLRHEATGLPLMVKDLKKKRADEPGERATPAKWKQIRERAGELAMNQGKRAHEAGKRETQRAKRELLDLRISSPKR